jgi:hypothetical protein
MSRDAFGGNSSRAAGSGPLECRQSSSRAKIGAEHESTRERQQATTIEFVANQQPEAVRKQQRGVSRQPRAVRLSHHPGDAAVRRVRRDARVRGKALGRPDAMRRLLSGQSDRSSATAGQQKDLSVAGIVTWSCASRPDARQ